MRLKQSVAHGTFSLAGSVFPFAMSAQTLGQPQSLQPTLADADRQIDQVLGTAEKTRTPITRKKNQDTHNSSP